MTPPPRRGDAPGPAAGRAETAPPPPSALVLARSAAFNALFLGLTALASVVGLALLPLPRAALRGYIRAYAGLMLWLLRVVCGVRWRLAGAENLPPGGTACLVAAKHQSAFDTLVWTVLLPRAAYVMKAELGRLPVWGTVARRFGNLAVDRAGGGAALRGLLRDARAAYAERRAQLVVFPEGTRSAPGERVAWQPGVVALAAALPPGAPPVVPAATDSGRCWGRRSFAKRPGTITVSVLPGPPPGLPRGALLGWLEAAVEGESARLLAAPPGAPGALVPGAPGGGVDESVDRDRRAAATGR